MLAADCWKLPHAVHIFRNLLSCKSTSEDENECTQALMQSSVPYLRCVAEQLQPYLQHYHDGSRAVCLDRVAVLMSGLQVALFRELRRHVLVAFSKCRSERSLGMFWNPRRLTVTSEYEGVIHHLSTIFFEQAMLYHELIGRQCPCPRPRNDAEALQKRARMPEPLKYIFGLFVPYREFGLLPIKKLASHEDHQPAEPVSVAATAGWHSALEGFRGKLAPTVDAVLYLHGCVAEHTLAEGFQQGFSKRHIFSDLLVLNTICLERGGTEAFYRWVTGPGGIQAFIEEFEDVRTTLLLSIREMLVLYQVQQRVIQHMTSSYLFQDDYHNEWISENPPSTSMARSSNA